MLSAGGRGTTLGTIILESEGGAGRCMPLRNDVRALYWIVFVMYSVRQSREYSGVVKYVFCSSCEKRIVYVLYRVEETARICNVFK